MYNEVIQIENAMNAKKLGIRQTQDPLIALRESMGDEIFESAYRLLNPGSKDMVKNVGIKKEIAAKKQLGFKGGLLGDVYFGDLQESSGKAIIADLIDRPKAEAKPGTYMAVFSDVIETSLKKQLGAKWRDDKNINKLFSGLRNPKDSNIWISSPNLGSPSKS